MTEFTKNAGIIILGLVIILVGFLPLFITWYKKNENKMQILKADAVAILGIGAVGLAVSLIFQYTHVNDKLWALIIIIVIELIRLACWVYLLVKAIKDEPLPIFW